MVNNVKMPEEELAVGLACHFVPKERLWSCRIEVIRDGDVRMREVKVKSFYLFGVNAYSGGPELEVEPDARSSKRFEEDPQWFKEHLALRFSIEDGALWVRGPKRLAWEKLQTS